MRPITSRLQNQFKLVQESKTRQGDVVDGLDEELERVAATRSYYARFAFAQRLRELPSAKAGRTWNRAILLRFSSCATRPGPWHQSILSQSPAR